MMNDDTLKAPNPYHVLSLDGGGAVVISGLAVIQTEPPNSPSRRSIRASAI
jgi:hypothetical protein